MQPQVRETDTRHGAARQLSPLPSVRCSAPGCTAAAARAAPGSAWPTHCGEHAPPDSVPTEIDPGRVPMEALNYALIFGPDAVTQQCDAEGLALAARVLGSSLVRADLRWRAAPRAPPPGFRV